MACKSSKVEITYCASVSSPARLRLESLGKDTLELITVPLVSAMATGCVAVERRLLAGMMSVLSFYHNSYGSERPPTLFVWCCFPVLWVSSFSGCVWMVFYSIKFRVSSLGTRFSLIEMTYEGFNVASSIRLFLHALAGCCLVGLPHPTEVNTRYHIFQQLISITHIDGTRFLFTPRLEPSACDIEKGCSLGKCIDGQ